MGNIVAIVGRPNVGKSTLYNRLVGGRDAIIDDISGVTRDRLYGNSYWNGKNFTVIDTGGFVKNTDDIFEKAIREQVFIAMEEASAIIMVVDVTTGITDLDEEIAGILRKTTKKPVFVAVNKVDNHQRLLAANEFWSLGFEQTFFIAAMSGAGSGELLDALSDMLDAEDEDENELPKFAIVGQPNVGKSSFVNALLGVERNIVTDIAGTTRDSIHSVYSKFDKNFMIIDTAGIRKKAKVHENLEFYSVMRAIKSIEDADICLLLIDAQTGLESQDQNILNLAIQRKKGIVILVNKWDLLEKETNTAKDFTEKIKRKIAPFNDVPIMFISVLEKQRIFQAIEAGLDVFERRSTRIKTSELNNVFQPILEKTPPPAHRGIAIRIKYVTQLPLKHPGFAFYCNHPSHVKSSYKHFLENQLRKHFNFTGVPITIVFKEK
ncbi:UNVERIFIED_CONTAM: hypothetical protein GTU68_024181 [Idotea baltica]|nr:hypothetical protein [Idotea baltica]